MPWPIKLPALRRPRSRRLTEAYQISGTLLLTLDQLGLVERDYALSFRRVALHNERYLVAEIDTRALSPELVKALRRYRLTVQLSAAVQRPVVAVCRQDWIEFVVDLGAPPPTLTGWQRFVTSAVDLFPRKHLLGAHRPGVIFHAEALP